jgi:hypothetical protein
MASDFMHFGMSYRDTDGVTGRLECTPDNTELYYHSPQWKEVDHLFIRINPDDKIIGAFVWRHILGEDVFEKLGRTIIASQNFSFHYRPYPAEADLEQYEHAVGGIPDELPDDFS